MSIEHDWTPSVRRVNSDARERLQYVVSLMREDRFDEARDELLTMLQEDEKSTQARMMLGSLYLRQEMHSDALDQFKQVIANDPLQVQAHVWAGTCCLRLNDLDQAKALLQTALDLDSKQARAHVGLAQVLAQTGQAAQAMSHVEEALRLDPQMAPARLLMAQLLSDAGNVDAAIDELNGFVETNPDHMGASVRLAMMERSKGNNARSVELLEAALQTNPRSGRIWDLLGRMKMVVKDYEGAERAFTEVIELDTQDRAAPFRLVDVLIKQGKLDQARDILQTLPRRGRMTSVVHRYYGDIYAARQHYDEAVLSYRASVLHTPDGERTLAEIEAAAGPNADSEAKVPHFRAAFDRLRDKRREEGRKGERGGFGAGRRAEGGGAVRSMANFRRR